MNKYIKKIKPMIPLFCLLIGGTIGSLFNNEENFKTITLFGKIILEQKLYSYLLSGLFLSISLFYLIKSIVVEGSFEIKKSLWNFGYFFCNFCLIIFGTIISNGITSSQFTKSDNVSRVISQAVFPVGGILFNNVNYSFSLKKDYIVASFSDNESVFLLKVEDVSSFKNESNYKKIQKLFSLNCLKNKYKNLKECREDIFKKLENNETALLNSLKTEKPLVFK